ncbi:MAG: hypothetical protein VX899_00295 [Myxococcota bacterium]|nr:hypothetical protein [Myxococcota bacterium]
MTPKARSVTQDGSPDGFVPETFFRADLNDVGQTRISVSVPPERLEATHQALLRAMDGPVGVLYVQMVDRRAGKQHPAPKRFLAMEKPVDLVGAVLSANRTLIYADARHQLWVRGRMREQLVLDELGMIHCYPDDPAFRDALAALGIQEGSGQNLDDRDYVQVDFKAQADAEEDQLMRALGMALLPEQ